MGTENGVVYGLRCSCHPNPYRYVGKTLADPRRRMSSHKYNARRGLDLPLYKWMRKHGLDNILCEVIERESDPERLLLAEIAAIDRYATHVTDGGLNCTRGGDGSLGWKQTRESIDKANAARAKTRGYTGRKPRKPKPRMDPSERRASILASRPRGERNGMSKLTHKDAIEIKECLWDGENQQQIADRFGVSEGTISSINCNRTWASAPWPADRPRHEVDNRVESLKSRKNPFLTWRPGPADQQVRLDQSKWTREDILRVRELAKQGLSYRDIRVTLGLDQSEKMIGSVVRGVRWGWVV